MGDIVEDGLRHTAFGASGEVRVLCRGSWESVVRQVGRGLESMHTDAMREVTGQMNGIGVE